MEAPSSLTLKTRQPSGFGTLLRNSSVSRPAVPLPTAITSTSYRAMSEDRVCMALTFSFAGGWGYITS